MAVCRTIVGAIAICGLVFLFSCADDETRLTPNPATPPGQQPPPPPKDTVPPSLISFKYAYDSILFTFNEPVKALYTAEQGYSINYDTTVGKYATSIKFLMTHPCIDCTKTPVYRVRDKAGNVKREEVPFSYYYKKLELPGKIEQFMFNEVEDKCFVLVTNWPDHRPVLVVVDLNTQSIIGNKIQLNLRQENAFWYRMAYNGYNGLMYVYSERDSYIYSFNLQDGTFIKETQITDEPVESGHNYNRIYPSKLAFTNSGKGLLISGNQFGGTGSNRLKIFDSSKNDSTYSLTQYDEADLRYLSGDHGGENIFLGISYVGPSNPLRTFDEAGEFGQLSFVKTGVPYLIKPNKKRNSIFVEFGLKLFIKNLDTGAETVNSYSGGGDTSGDFSYAEGEDNSVWVFDYWNGNFALLDYDRAETIIEYSIKTEFRDLTTTKDNQYLLMSQGQYLYFFRITDIRRTNFSQP